MPFLNFENRHFTENEKTDIATAISTLEQLLTPKLANLTPEERQQYGSVNEQNKLIINKVKDYRSTKPELSSPDIDWAEFENDYQSREFIQDINQRLEGLLSGLQSAKILHDWDNYQAALTDYGYTQYKKGSGAVGYDAKINELRQFFSRTTSTSSNTDTES